MSQQIDVIVDAQGQTRIETIGFAGDRCRDASRALERALGIATREQLKAEFFSQAAQQTQHIQE